LNLVDRLDRYSDPDTSFRSPALAQFLGPRPPPRRIVKPRRAAEPHAAVPDTEGELPPDADAGQLSR
jgi:hypothetical protein